MPSRRTFAKAGANRALPPASRALWCLDVTSFRPLWATSGEGFSSPQRRPTHESIDILIAHQVEDVRDKQPVKRRYVDQVSVSLRPNTVRHIELDLRRFGTWLTNHYPDVACCADLERHHIEAFKTWLSTTPTPGTGKPLNRVSIKNALINLHCFFDRVTEWGYPNAPVRPLVFIGDLPIIDKPLPRFLDDAAAAKLLRTTRQDTDPLARLIVELLARTGIRVGELLALTVDAVLQIGSAAVGAAGCSGPSGACRRAHGASRRRRMLGNGYCARPVEMDCHFESICESCNFFVTTIEFRPTLQRQRDDAARKGQVGRLNRYGFSAVLI
jgi:hypothetical protein